MIPSPTDNIPVLPFQAETASSLFMRVLRGKPVERPPVWMMRQAGRFLPSYMQLKARYSFFERVETPELAAEITLMPVEQLGVDAAIIFSDILVVPQALGFTVTMQAGEGPRLPRTVRTPADVDSLFLPDMAARLGYVLDALRLTRQRLAGRVPLLGFAGSPWTLFCYLVEGRGSKEFTRAKAFAFAYPEASTRLLQLLADATVDYLRAQFQAGADAVQVFDSWGGLLGADDYRQYSLPYLQQIVAGLEGLPVILYAKGCRHVLGDLAQTGATGLGIDWQTDPQEARQIAGPEVVLQGNLDPSRLLSPPAEIARRTNDMLRAFGRGRYIANLGHGILPEVPVDHARAFIETVQSFRYEQT